MREGAGKLGRAGSQGRVCKTHSGCTAGRAGLMAAGRGGTVEEEAGPKPPIP